MSKRRALSEEEKLQIAMIYKTTNKSVGAIADFLGYSVETINRYKEYKGESKKKESSDRPSENIEETCPDEIVRPLDKYEKSETIEFVGGTSFKQEDPEIEEDEYFCEECKYQLEGYEKYCPKCGQELDWDKFD